MTACARQSAKICLPKCGAAFVLGHFLNYHPKLSQSEFPEALTYSTDNSGGNCSLIARLQFLRPSALGDPLSAKGGFAVGILITWLTGFGREAPDSPPKTRHSARRI